MDNDHFRALVLHDADGTASSLRIEECSANDLPEGDVVISVEYSSLNYKDALAMTGKGKIVRRFPMVPGIDLAGTVLSSTSPDFKEGTSVVVTGFGLGEERWGGYAQRARVPSGSIVSLPESLDTRRAMAIGTAGFTAMLCVLRLEEAGITAERGRVVVTGAGGGVGSIAIAILAKLGYQVAAVTGRPELEPSLRNLGASEIIERQTMETDPRPLEKQRWAGAVDTVGGRILARVLAETEYGGAVAACGLAGGASFPGHVMPFILRAISLLGAESVVCPIERRRRAWSRLATDLPIAKLDSITQEAGLDNLLPLSGEILAGRIHGRVVIDPNR